MQPERVKGAGGLAFFYDPLRHLMVPDFFHLILMMLLKETKILESERALFHAKPLSKTWQKLPMAWEGCSRG